MLYWLYNITNMCWHFKESILPSMQQERMFQTERQYYLRSNTKSVVNYEIRLDFVIMDTLRRSGKLFLENLFKICSKVFQIVL